MALLEILGRRWTLRVLWEMRNAPLSFRALQQASGGLSPTVLNQRLKELRSNGIIALTDNGYDMTPAGRDLLVHVLELDKWAKAWIPQGEQDVPEAGAKDDPQA